MNDALLIIHKTLEIGETADVLRLIEDGLEQGDIVMCHSTKANEDYLVKVVSVKPLQSTCTIERIS